METQLINMSTFILLDLLLTFTLLIMVIGVGVWIYAFYKDHGGNL